MKLAQIRYDIWRQTNEYYMNKSIELWACGDLQNSNNDISIKKLFIDIADEKKIREEMRQGGKSLPPKPEEISLEKKIIDMMKDGWSMKGEITACSDNEWIQTMVKYEVVKSEVVKPKKPIVIDFNFLFN